MKKEFKKIIGTTIFGLGLGLLLTIPAGATDYQAYSLEELNAMRGNMATASTEDRDSFKSARQEKMQSLSPDERLSYQTDNGKGSGTGNGNAMRVQDGSGSGSMNRYGGSGGGGGMGSGKGRGGKR